jgi:hypothetical protein
MFSRTSSVLLGLAVLPGCSEQAPHAVDAMSGEPSTVPCALRGAKSYSAECRIEREVRDGRTIITVRHPDGGFRRLVESADGLRYSAADGAQAVEIVPNGKEIEVTLGDDHYLFPAPGPAPGNAAPR